MIFCYNKKMKIKNDIKIIPVYKKIGETPYQLVQKFRKKENISEELKIAYAGRLDPMAEGVILLVIGKKTNNI